MAGCKWSTQEDQLLVELFNDGKSNGEIAVALGNNRTPKSISVRLSLKGITNKHTLSARGHDNLVGTKSGKLTAIALAGVSSSGARLWCCECECGGIAIVPSYHLKRNNVKSCGCLKLGELNPAWKGFKQIGNAFWGGYERGAKQRSIQFNITIEEGWRLYEEQQGKCFFTGQPISFSTNSKLSRHGTASLDRKDSSKGYTVDNCVWVHKDINRFKNNYSVDEFVNMCTMVAKHYRAGE